MTRVPKIMILTPLMLSSCMVSAQSSIDDLFPGPCLAVSQPLIWQPVTRLSTGVGVVHPHVAAGSNGTATAVWIAPDPFANKFVYASHYTPGAFRFNPGVWSPAVRLGTAGPNTTWVRVAMDELGNSLVAWDGVPAAGREQIVTRFYSRSAQAWRPAQTIPGAAFLRRQVAIALVGQRGVAVWVNQATMYDKVYIYASILASPSVAWTMPHRISTEQAEKPVVAMDSSRRMVAVWQQESGIFATNITYIYGARYLPAAGWANPEHLDSAGLQETAVAPDLALNADGTGVVGWIQKRALSGETVLLRRIDLSQPLTAMSSNAAQPGNPGEFLSSVKVSSDTYRNVGAMFSRRPLGGPSSVYARIQTATNLLNPNPAVAPFSLESRIEDATQIWTAMDRDGNSLTGWVQSDGQAPSIYASVGSHIRSSPGCMESWAFSPATLVETLPLPARELSGAMSSRGAGVFLWTAYAGRGVTDLYARVVTR